MALTDAPVPPRHLVPQTLVALSAASMAVLISVHCAAAVGDLASAASEALSAGMAFEAVATTLAMAASSTALLMAAQALVGRAVALVRVAFAQRTVARLALP